MKRIELTVELFVSDKTGAKMVFISRDGASGAEYPYETAKDIGNAIASYLSSYCQEEEKTNEQKQNN